MADERMTKGQLELLSHIKRICDEVKIALGSHPSLKDKEFYLKNKFSFVLSIAGVDMMTWSQIAFPRHRLENEDKKDFKKSMTLRKKYHRRLNLLRKKGLIEIERGNHFYKNIEITQKGLRLLNKSLM